MAVVVQSATETVNSLSGTITATAPSGVVSGDLLVAIGVASIGANYTATGWTQYKISSQGTLLYRVATGSDSYVFSNGSTANNTILVFRVTGQDATTPILDGVSVTQSAGSNVVLTSLSPASSAFLLSGAILPGSSVAVTIPAGETAVTISPAAGANGYNAGSESVSSGATGTRTYSWTGTVAGAAAIIAIGPSSVGFSGSATQNATATISAVGQVATSTSATQSATATVTGTGIAVGAATQSATAAVSAAGSGGSTGPLTATATITAAGTVPSGAAQSITATLSVTGAGAGAASAAVSASVTAVGGGSAAPTRATTATVTAAGGPAPSLTVTATATVSADGVVGGTAITVNKRPLVMDRGLVREFRDTDVLVGSGSGAPPTLIAEDTQYEVKENTQVLTFATCRVDGTLIVTGTLQ